MPCSVRTELPGILLRMKAVNERHDGASRVLWHEFVTNERKDAVIVAVGRLDFEGRVLRLSRVAVAGYNSRAHPVNL